MRRLVALVVGVSVLVAAVTLPALGAPKGWSGAYRKHSLAGTATYPARDYKTYVPRGLPRSGRALVVYLHGTSQTADNAAYGVGWNELADRERFVVVYPEQRYSETYDADGGNPGRAWSWGQAFVEDREHGEVASIAAITRAVARARRIDPRRVFITGASAGAIMASVMAASYPELYRGLGVVAGCSYLCADTSGDLTIERMNQPGPHARVVPTILFAGSLDPIVNLAMTEHAIAGWVGANDLADDGSANSSVSRTPVVRHRDLDAIAFDPSAHDPDGADVGATCIYANPPKGNYPCPGKTLGWSRYPSTVRTYRSGEHVIVESWLIHGISHGYGGGRPDPRATYVDPLGPDITARTWAFWNGEEAT
jgi:poly(hydroxyalkanoate) depolymerase family esterase